MAIVTRPVTYYGVMQRIVVSSLTSGTVTATLWGGGGGSGGVDAYAGGAGGGAGYATKTFTAVSGDVIDIAVGGGGGAGVSTPGTGGAAGGAGGGSYRESTGVVFDSRNPPGGQPPVYAQYNSAYVPWLNTYGVWEENTYAGTFDRTYTINVPTTGIYTLTSSCDNLGTVYIDGAPILQPPTYTYTVSTDVTLTAGAHTIRTVGTNLHGPGSMGTTLIATAGAGSYSGAVGGRAGYAGWSGGGGGSGGASIVFLNGSAIAVAGGGGGGGGGGRYSAGTPGNSGAGRAAPGTNAGQDGQNHPGDGGGGGGGGGGYGGGNGGSHGAGDVGGFGGDYGGSLGDATGAPSGRFPAGPYSTWGQVGIGGDSSSQAGTNGIVILSFDINGMYVNKFGSWAPVLQTYIKHNGVWQPVQETYVKQGGQWRTVQGTNDVAPMPTNLGTANFGVSSRVNNPAPPPEPPDPGYG